jgi:hypothetical protein
MYVTFIAIPGVYFCIALYCCRGHNHNVTILSFSLFPQHSLFRYAFFLFPIFYVVVSQYDPRLNAGSESGHDGGILVPCLFPIDAKQDSARSMFLLASFSKGSHSIFM